MPNGRSMMMCAGALATMLACAGCATVTPEQIQEQAAQGCTAAGFEAGSDAFKLCLLLQDTNQRIARLERQIEFLELDVRRLDLFPRHHRH